MTELQEIQRLHDRHRAEYDKIIREYGTGVRPSWVSTELAIRWNKIEQCKQEMERLSNEVSN